MPSWDLSRRQLIRGLVAAFFTRWLPDGAARPVTPVTSRGRFSSKVLARGHVTTTDYDRDGRFLGQHDSPFELEWVVFLPGPA